VSKQTVKCCANILPHNAARPFKKPAEVLFRASIRGLIKAKKGGVVLDFGGGALRNAFYLQSHNFKVHVVEVKGIEDRFPDQYSKFLAAGGLLHYAFPKETTFDLALSTFVIETICNIEERKRLLEEIHKSLSSEGALILSVRGPKDLVTAKASGIKCSDGFITPNKTFARSFTRQQLLFLLKTCGFSKIEFLHKGSTKCPEYLHAVGWK
jgi:Methyltransferase domain